MVVDQLHTRDPAPPAPPGPPGPSKPRPVRRTTHQSAFPSCTECQRRKQKVRLFQKRRPGVRGLFVLTNIFSSSAVVSSLASIVRSEEPPITVGIRISRKKRKRTTRKKANQVGRRHLVWRKVQGQFPLAVSREDSCCGGNVLTVFSSSSKKRALDVGDDDRSCQENDPVAFDSDVALLSLGYAPGNTWVTGAASSTVTDPAASSSYCH